MGKGRAYGFVHCDALKEEVQREMPALKEAGKISNLEIIVIDTLDLLRFERDEVSRKDIESLAYFIESANDNDLNYVLRATISEQSNKEVARKLSHLLMQTSQSYLNRLSEIWGKVIYKNENGIFCFL